jgi:hypothetical protein
MLHGAGIFTNIYPKNGPNVGKYYIHGAYGLRQKDKKWESSPEMVVIEGLYKQFPIIDPDN